MENYAADTSSGSTFLYSKKFLAFTKMDKRTWDVFDCNSIDIRKKENLLYSKKSLVLRKWVNEFLIATCIENKKY